MAGPTRTPSVAPRGRPGAELGLPATGAGRLSSWPRRVLALVVDWVLCLLASFALVSRDRVTGGDARLLPVLVLVVQSTVLVTTLGGSAGQLLTGVRVRPVGGGVRVGPGRSLLRAVLLALVVPAAVFDRDRRGLHDRAARSVVVTAA